MNREGGRTGNLKQFCLIYSFGTELRRDVCLLSFLTSKRAKKNRGYGLINFKQGIRSIARYQDSGKPSSDLRLWYGTMCRKVTQTFTDLYLPAKPLTSQSPWVNQLTSSTVSTCLSTANTSVHFDLLRLLETLSIGYINGCFLKTFCLLWSIRL